MATVAELVRQGDLYMQFINYHETYHDNNKEVLRGYMLQLYFLNVPKIV